MRRGSQAPAALTCLGLAMAALAVAQAPRGSVGHQHRGLAPRQASTDPSRSRVDRLAECPAHRPAVGPDGQGQGIAECLAESEANLDQFRARGRNLPNVRDPW